MKIVFSRKGFDSGSGGGASPILPGDRLVSLPIPDYRGETSYGDLSCADGVDVAQLVSDLSGGRYRPRHKAHLDPDLDEDSISRPDGWRGAFGQTGAAARHLDNQRVGEGDVFLFFGWFRDVEKVDGRWRYAPKGRNVHAIFGWLQVDEVVRLSSGCGSEWEEKPWLATHPHVGRPADPNNRIYIGRRAFGLHGLEDTAGFGVFRTLDQKRILTGPGGSRSIWRVPSWFHSDHGAALSYHGDEARWQRGDGACRLNTVGRGQEFVLDCRTRPHTADYLRELIGDGRVDH